MIGYSFFQFFFSILGIMLIVVRLLIVYVLRPIKILLNG